MNPLYKKTRRIIIQGAFTELFFPFSPKELKKCFCQLGPDLVRGARSTQNGLVDLGWEQGLQSLLLGKIFFKLSIERTNVVDQGIMS